MPRLTMHLDDDERFCERCGSRRTRISAKLIIERTERLALDLVEERPYRAYVRRAPVESRASRRRPLRRE